MLGGGVPNSMRNRTLIVFYVFFDSPFTALNKCIFTSTRLLRICVHLKDNIMIEVVLEEVSREEIAVLRKMRIRSRFMPRTLEPRIP